MSAGTYKSTINSHHHVDAFSEISPNPVAMLPELYVTCGSFPWHTLHNAYDGTKSENWKREREEKKRTEAKATNKLAGSQKLEPNFSIVYAAQSTIHRFNYSHWLSSFN